MVCTSEIAAGSSYRKAGCFSIETVVVSTADSRHSEFSGLMDGILHNDGTAVLVTDGNYIVAGRKVGIGLAYRQLTVLVVVQFVQIFTTIEGSAYTVVGSYRETTGAGTVAVSIHVVAAAGGERFGLCQFNSFFVCVTAVGIGYGHTVSAGTHIGEVVGMTLIAPFELVRGGTAGNCGGDAAICFAMAGGGLQRDFHRRLCVHRYGDVLRGLAVEVVVRLAADNGYCVAAGSVRLELFGIIVACNIFHVQISGM